MHKLLLFACELESLSLNRSWLCGDRACRKSRILVLVSYKDHNFGSEIRAMLVTCPILFTETPKELYQNTTGSFCLGLRRIIDYSPTDLCLSVPHVSCFHNHTSTPLPQHVNISEHFINVYAASPLPISVIPAPGSDRISCKLAAQNDRSIKM